VARIRTIKPDFWGDSRCAKELTRDRRLFYIGLWNEADDEGRFLAHPRRLLGAIFPYEKDLTEEWVSDSLRALAETKRLILYVADGEPYGQLVKFLDHQKINRPTPSKIPSPDNELSIVTDYSVNGHGEITEASPLEGKGRDQGKEQGMSKPPVVDMWAVWIEELGGDPPHANLTSERKKKLESLYVEQLSGLPDPMASFRTILRAVQRSQHHMSDRSYQMPESLFVNAERRDTWMQKALGKNGSGTKSTGRSVPRAPEIA
jgi:hypothetical protein